MERAFMNWSGGKDAALALWKIRESGKYRVEALLSAFHSDFNRLSMHGVRRSLIEAQARALDLPLFSLELAEQPGMTEYETALDEAVSSLKAMGMSHSIYGDLFLEDLRIYRENFMKPREVSSVFPLWGRQTAALARELLALGFGATIVCVNERYLDQSFCGRELNAEFLADLPPGVDPCGENGEFHSFVHTAPLFAEPIAVKRGELVYRKYRGSTEKDGEPYGFYFCDLLPD